MIKNLAIFILLCAAITGLENEEPEGNEGKSEEITLEEFGEVVSSGSQLVIDVREPDDASWESVGAKRYINIPFQDVEPSLDLSPEDFKWMYNEEKPESDEDFVFISENGKTSEKALKVAEELNFTNARHLKGGASLWSKERSIILSKVGDEEEDDDESTNVNITNVKDEL